MFSFKSIGDMSKILFPLFFSLLITLTTSPKQAGLKKQETITGGDKQMNSDASC